MKTTLLLTAFTMIMSSFTTYPVSETRIGSSEELAERVVAALQHNSPEEYESLFPSLTEFHQLMEKNGIVYGRFLPEAKEEFSKEYQNELVPQVKDSFSKIIAQGNSKGIEWSEIRLEKVEPEMSKGFLPAFPVTFTFVSNGREFRLQVERVILIGEEYRITQYIKFVE